MRSKDSSAAVLSSVFEAARRRKAAGLPLLCFNIFGIVLVICFLGLSCFSAIYLKLLIIKSMVMVL